MSNSNNVNSVNNSGNSNNNNANNSNYVVPDYTKCQLRVSLLDRNQNIVQGAIIRAVMAKSNAACECFVSGCFMEEDVKEKVCNLKRLYKALRKSKCGVIWKDSVARSVMTSLHVCHRLKQLLLADEYEILPYVKHTVYGPKIRHIECTRFRDRVFQRSLCDNYLYKEITKNFILDNCSSQKKKGTDFARDRLSFHLKEHYSKFGLTGYALKCDLKDFYGSTLHSVAKETMSEYISDSWTREHVCKIIDSFCKEDLNGRGMGLGSQVTQLVQLALLDKLDHLIVEKLNIRYLRYNDDFLLISNSKDKLIDAKHRIEDYLIKKRLILSKKKTQIFPITQPIHFLGFSFRLNQSGKVTKKLLPEKLSHEKRKLKKQASLVKAGKLTIEKLDFCYQTWRSYAKKGDSRKQLKQMDDFYRDLRNCISS